MTKLNVYLQPVRQRPWWIYLGAITLVAVSLWAANYAYTTSMVTQLTFARLEKQERQRTAALPTKPTRAQIEEEKLWEQLALERDFDWQSLFVALQNANHQGIELLEFRPEKRQGVIVLRGEAKSVFDLSAYLQKISEQPAFVQIYLTKQDLRAHGQLETIGFEIRGNLKR